MLELSLHEFKMTMINIFKVLMDKVDCMQEQLCSIGREMKTLRKNQK